MKRTLNFTGRHKISRDRVDIALESSGSSRSFILNSMDLSGIDKFKGDEKIYIEAYYENTWMRFPYGTVNTPRAVGSTDLEDLAGTQVIYFRIKVVDESEELGKIVAIADRISIVSNAEENNKDPLLPVNYMNLGDEVWKIAFLDDGPVLEINNSINGIENFVRTNPCFQSLVLPQALRQILVQILYVDTGFDNEDERDWKFRWLKFASMISGQKIPENEDDSSEEFFNQALIAFASLHKYNQQLDTYLNDHIGVNDANLK